MPLPSLPVQPGLPATPTHTTSAAVSQTWFVLVRRTVAIVWVVPFASLYFFDVRWLLVLRGSRFATYYGAGDIATVPFVPTDVPA